MPIRTITTTASLDACWREHTFTTAMLSDPDTASLASHFGFVDARIESLGAGQRAKWRDEGRRRRTKQETGGRVECRGGVQGRGAVAVRGPKVRADGEDSSTGQTRPAAEPAVATRRKPQPARGKEGWAVAGGRSRRGGR